MIKSRYRHKLLICITFNLKAYKPSIPMCIAISGSIMLGHIMQGYLASIDI